MAKLPCFVKFALANRITFSYKCFPSMPCCDKISFIFHDGAPVDLIFNIILIVRLRLARFRLFLHHGLVVRAATLIVGAVLRIFIALTISGYLCKVAGLSNYVT